MKFNIRLVLITLYVFFIFNCEYFDKKTLFYTNLDLNANLPTGTRIYYGNAHIGRVTEITLLIEEKKNRVKFFIYDDYRTIAREGAKIVFKLDSDNIVRRIEISPDIDFESSSMLPEKGYFIPIID
jgi:hypothetical protein